MQTVESEVLQTTNKDEEDDIQDQILVVEGENLLIDANDMSNAPDHNANVYERPKTPRYDYQQFKARLNALDFDMQK